MMSPGVLLLALFFLWPAFDAVRLSFTEYDVVTPPVAVGLENYRAIASDERFWAAVRTAGLFILGLIPFATVVPLAIAALANTKIRGIGIYRAIYFFPVIVSMVIAALCWRQLFDGQGLLNWALVTTGLITEPVDILLHPQLAVVGLILLEAWKGMGTYIMIYLAGLQGISEDLYDSARIDGAGVQRQFWSITVPLMRGHMAVCTTVAMINALQVFTSVYLLTRGGPEDSTLTLGYYVWESAFQNFKMGYASAVGVIALVILSVLSYINLTVNRRMEARS